MGYTFSLAEDIRLPNIAVYRKMLDGTPTAYRLEAADGYIMYDTASAGISEDPATGQATVVRNYTNDVRCPLNYDFSCCTWKAIREEDIESDERAFLERMAEDEKMIPLSDLESAYREGVNSI